ncbi:MAG: SCO family protein, partial [Candidatus Zixiibacteriota bacterium]
MTDFRNALLTSTVALVALLTVSAAFAQRVQETQQGDLAKIDIVEHLGDTIPMDLSFTSDEGQPVTLNDYFNKGKPVIVVLGYYQCPMLCNLVFNGLSEGVKGLGWTPGDRFEMVMVSINPRETAQLAAAKKANYVKQLGNPDAAKGWHFLVGDSVMSARLADAIGFKYFYDAENKQYAHPAAAYVLTEKGVISRYLYGIQFSPRDLKLSLLEASDGKIGSTADRLILY